MFMWVNLLKRNVKLVDRWVNKNVWIVGDSTRKIINRVKKTKLRNRNI